MPSRTSPLKYANMRNRVKSIDSGADTTSAGGRCGFVLKDMPKTNGSDGGEKVLDDIDGIGQLTRGTNISASDMSIVK